MSSLINAMNANGRTTNGARTLTTTRDAVLDLFFAAGASRGKDISGLVNAALAQDAELTARLLLWLRDVRGGAGERDLFRAAHIIVAEHDVNLAIGILRRLPELGRWDDVIIWLDPTDLKRNSLLMQEHAIHLIRQGLASKDRLLAKWMPRKGPTARVLRELLGLNPSNYRKLIVGLSETVEQQMCAGEWDKINFSHVPSIAAKNYSTAFGRHDTVRYGQYKADLKKVGTDEAVVGVKVNAAAIFPYDVLKSMYSDPDLANAQWKALPDFLNGSTESILPVVDVSGSMGFHVPGGTTALQVAVSLGIYLSERSRGPFKDSFVTFSATPALQTLHGTLQQRVQQLKQAQWDMNTNLKAVFKLILNSAVRDNVPQEDMPTKVLILSDMEFDQCVTAGQNRFGGVFDDTAMEMIEREYQAAGYVVPQVVFWNLNARQGGGNNPVAANKKNTALVSGFSPSIMKAVLGGDDFSPRGVMLKTLLSDRYNLI